MLKKTEHTHRPDETAQVEQALKESAARVEPDSGFIERLSIRLKHAHAGLHAQQVEPQPSRLPRLAWIGAAAALIVAAIGIAWLLRPGVPTAPPPPESPVVPTQPLATPTTAIPMAEAPVAEAATPVTVETEPPFLADLPPAVVSSQPRNGEEVNLKAGVFVRFSQPMDRSSVEAALQVTPPITGTFTWHDDRTVSFGGKALASATRYRVILGASAQAANGLPLGRDLAFAFSTVGPLEVTHTSPADGGSRVRGDAPLLLSFNYPLVPINCTGQAAEVDGPCVPLPLQITPEIAGKGMWVNSGVYRFDPDPVWTAGETYTITVPGEVIGVDGAPLEAPLTFTFSTAVPATLAAEPAHHANAVSLDSDVRLTFNTPMDTDATEVAFSLEDPQGRTVEGSFGWMDSTTRLVFTPTVLLEPDTRYDVRIDASARAQSGVPLDEGYLSYFTTTPTLGVIRMSGRTSDALVGRLDYYESAQVVFRGIIDPTTTDDAITVIHDASGDKGEVSVYWDLSPTVSTAYVHWDRRAGERYCITVEQTLADLYGNYLAEPETACFEIRDMPPTLTPIGGDTIITLDADAPATVVFSSLNTGEIDLTLGSVALRDMLGYHEQVRTEPLRTLSVRPGGEANEAVIVPVELNGGEPLPTGFYGLTWMPPGQTMWRRTLRIAVVDRHVLIKASEDEALVWVTDLRTGQPVAGADVRALTMANAELGRGITDADGLVRIPFSGINSLWDPLTAITGEAGRPGFGIGRTDWNRDVSPGRFGIAYDYERPPTYRGSLHTDRPIYRPDQEVKVWGVLRVDDDARYALPDEVTEVQVELRAFDGTVLEQAELPLSASGTFETSFSLPQDIRLGTYTLELNVAGERTAVARAELAVAAYRKPEFEVVVTPEAENVLDGEATRLLVEATYYSGGPVDGATVRWTLSARPAGFVPETTGRWRWSASPAMWAYWQESEIIAEGEGVTDRDGRLLVTLDTDLAPLSDQETAQAQRWTLEATVTDESGFPASRRGEMTVHTSRVYVGVRPQSWVTLAGSPTDIDLVALDWDGLPQARERLTVTLARRTWRHTPATEPTMSDTWTYEDTVVETTGVTTDGDGLATTTLTPPRSGPYVVFAEGRDRDGNEYRGETHLYVSGPEAAAWQVPEGRIEPVADAEEYRPGDTARILLPTPFRGPFEVLMTIERGSILEVRRFTVRESNPLIEIPITDAHAPNVVVTFALVKGVGVGQSTPDVRIGMVNLEVMPVNQRLDIAVEPSCPGPAPCTYGPGDTVELTVRATDAAGDPVDAALALSVVDKAVLALAEDRTPTLTEAFYAPRPLGVITGDSLLTLHNRVTSDLDELRRNAMRYALEGMIGGIGGGGGDGAAARSPDVRTDFPDTALWDPHLRTGADGEVTVTVTLPDSLTTWVIRARAVTAETQVGEGTAEFVVSKPLLIRPVTPRFFVAGDRATLAMVVHNNTGTDLTVTPRLQTNLALAAPAPGTLTVPAHGRARVDWMVTVPASGLSAADLVFSAAGGGYRDAARPAVGRDGSLPIYRYESPDVVSVSGALNQAGSRVEVVIVPPEAGPESTLTVRLSPTLAAGMVEGLDYLETFPHACTEQLVSRFLPNVVSTRALRDLGRHDPELEAHLTQLVEETLSELYTRQNADGGWGWWNRLASDLQTSAYATLGLIMAERAGFQVDARSLERALDLLQRRLNTSLLGERMTLTQALTLYVLSEADQALPDEVAERLFEDRHILEATGRAYLALGLGFHDPDDPRVTTLLDDLRADADLTASGAHWESTVSEHWITTTRATSVALSALVRLAPDDPLLPQVVRWLMAARHKDRWETTQETAWAVMALTDYMVVTGELDAAYEWGLALNGEPLDQGTVTAANRGTPVEQVISVANLLRNWPNGLEISRGEGPGTLTYTADLALALPVEQLEAESRGITIERRICRVTTLDRRGDDEPCEPVAAARPGDLVEVRLTLIVPRTRNYVILEAPYPAGMEPVDPTLATEQQDADPTFTTGIDRWWQRTFDYAELRDERAVFYATRLNAGTHEARFYLRAAVPGDYQVLPATASEMYFPEVWGRTTGALFTVTD
jgi:alpha-2-macroglobulin